MDTQAQVSETHWNFLFDVDAGKGTQTRVALLERYHDDRTLIAGGHFAGAVFGGSYPLPDTTAGPSPRPGNKPVALARIVRSTRLLL